jgi:hypothetical protein
MIRDGVVRSWILDARYWILLIYGKVTISSRIEYPVSTGISNLSFGGKTPETSDKTPETRNQKPETRDQQPE